jgi:hypothetical protein
VYPATCPDGNAVASRQERGQGTEGGVLSDRPVVPRAGRSALQDIAVRMLACDLRDMRLAQRSSACSPRLPGVAARPGDHKGYGPLGGVERPAARSASRDWSIGLSAFLADVRSPPPAAASQPALICHAKCNSAGEGVWYVDSRLRSTGEPFIEIHRPRLRPERGDTVSVGGRLVREPEQPQVGRHVILHPGRSELVVKGQKRLGMWSISRP